MQETQAVPVEDLIKAAHVLSGEVSRPSLHQALIQSKLLDRQVSREELRWRIPDPAAWFRHVSEALRHRDRHAAALRALWAVANEYIKLPHLDHRIHTCFTKAQTAAMRGDVERLRRQVERIEEFGEELDHPALKQARLIVYVSIPSEDGRRCVEALSAQAEPASSATIGASLVAASSSVAQNPTTVESGNDPLSEAMTEPASSALLADIRKLANDGSRPARTAEIDLAVRRAELRLPAASIDWPSLEESNRDLQALLLRVRELLTSWGDNSLLSIGRLASAESLVEELASLSERFASLKVILRSLREQSRARAEAAVNGLPAAEQESARTSLTSLVGTEQSDDSAEKLNEIVSAYYRKVEEAADETLRIVERIKAICSELPEEVILENRDDIHRLVADYDVAGLQAIEAALASKRSAAQEHEARVRGAAKAVLAELQASPHDASEQVLNEILRAIRAGDAERALQNLPRSLPDVTNEKAASRGSERWHSPPAPSARAPLDLTRAVVARSDFRPRDRVTASQLKMLPSPQADVSTLLESLDVVEDLRQALSLSLQLRAASKSDAASVLGVLYFLFWRALEELDRGSSIGLYEHALDILALVADATSGGEPWVVAALTLLCAPVSPPSIISRNEPQSSGVVWALRNRGADALPDSIAALYGTPVLEGVIADRLISREVKPFVTTLSSAMSDAGRRHLDMREHLLEDVARSSGIGAEHGDYEVAYALLLALAREEGVHSKTIEAVSLLLTSAARQSSLDPKLLESLPEWLAEGVTTYNAAMAKVAARRTQTRTTKPLHVQMPPSVQRSGGFPLRQGADHLEIALLVSNPKASGRKAVGAEIILPAQRNKKWLRQDVVLPIGTLDEDTRYVVPIAAPLLDDFREEDQQLRAQFQLRWRDPGMREPGVQDGEVGVSLSHLKVPSIEDYDRADGTPIILRGPTLELSSSSVRDALRDIADRLQRGAGVAALVVGRRRRGKTSILETIKNDRDVGNRYVILSDSWEDLPSRTLRETLQHLGVIFDRMARKLGIVIDSLGQILSSSASPGWNDIQDWIERLSDKLSAPVKILLLIDEFQKWISLIDGESRARVLSILRGLFNRPPGAALSISIVLSGLSNIKEYLRSNADFRNAFRVYDIRSFNQKEAESLAQTRPSNSIHALSQQSGICRVATHS